MKTYEIRVQRLNEMPDAPKIDSPREAVQYWNEVITKMPWFIPDREVCVVITLNTRHRITGHSLVSLGTLNESVVHCREVFRAGVVMAAYAIVLMHCHPSGDPSPSEADHRITRRMADAAGILQVNLMDHVIIGVPGENRPGYFSFKEAGVL
jgi:DNA repair protein RadC